MARGDIVRVARGRYALPVADAATATALRVKGSLALRSAALEHGWAVKWSPRVPEIAIARHRRAPSVRGIRLVWVPSLDPGSLVVPPLETVLMCARALPFDEALAIADSALRSGSVTRRALRDAADGTRGAGSARVRRVAAEADARAANPFESVLRAITLQEGLVFEPQRAIELGERVVHPDLVDPVRRVVLEADSWEWHTGKRAHVDDCWRYNALVAAGWLVLRLAWEHVMLQPTYVADLLATVYGRPARQAEVPFRRPMSA